MTADTIRDAFRRQADACQALGSPFTARLCRLHAERLESGSALADRILGWTGDPSPAADSVPLRLAGSLHALVLEERDPELASVYPPREAEDDALWRAVAAAEASHTAFLLERLGSAPQTNEVRRSGALLPGFLALGAMFEMPLVLSEVGASAGLNLQWDRYRYELGARIFGPSTSKVLIAPDWRGAAPPRGDVRVAERRGCDIHPVDAGDPADRLRMLSYVWADQPDRFERTAHAFDIASREGLRVDKADAVDWLTERLATARPNEVHVVYHTIAWQYLPEALRAKGDAVIAEAGARATADAPLARLSLEADGRTDGASLTLQVWPSGEKQEIARADFHGRWVEWRGWS
jgi:hypothetical protein